VRYFVLRAVDDAPSILARLDEEDVEVCVREGDAWHSANELLPEIVSDASWQEIDLHTAEQVASAL